MPHSTLTLHKCLRAVSLGVTLIALSHTAYAGFEISSDVDLSAVPAAKAAPAKEPEPAAVPQPAVTSPVVKTNANAQPVSSPIDSAKEKAELAAAIKAEEQEVKTPPQECWNINPSQQKLSTAMEEWAKKAGWQMLWENNKDFPIDVNGTFCSSYQDAVKTVLETYRNSDAPIKAKFYRGNNVVRFVSGAN